MFDLVGYPHTMDHAKERIVILDEFSEDIQAIQHVHIDESVMTVVSSNKSSLHVYKGSARFGFYKIQSTFMVLVLQFLKMRKFFNKLTDALSSKTMLHVSSVQFAGEYTIGVYKKQSLVFFNNRFQEELFEECIRNNAASYISNAVDIKHILINQHLVSCITLIVLDAAPNAIIISKDLYIALFGLDAFQQKLEVLLLCITSGQIWYIALQESAVPEFLYSVESSCIKVCADTCGSTINVFTRKHKIFSFVPNMVTFRVEEKLVKLDKGQFLNLCHDNAYEGHESCQHIPFASGKFLLVNRNKPWHQSEEEQLKNLRFTIRDLEEEKKLLVDLIKTKRSCLQHVKTMADISTLNKKVFDVRFTDSHMEIEWVFTDCAFSSFYVVLVGDSKSLTFFCNSKVLKISTENAILYKAALFYLFEDGVWISSGKIHYNPLNFAKYCGSYDTADDVNRMTKLELFFSNITFTGLTDLINALFSPELAVDQSQFRIRLLNYEVFIHLLMKDNFVLLASCSNRYVLKHFYRALQLKQNIL